MDWGEIDRQGELWPYQQVAAAITAAIRSGELEPGRRLPSLVRMAQEARVSKSTVQNALAVLIDEGLVYTLPRLGVFVSPQPPRDAGQ